MASDVPELSSDESEDYSENVTGEKTTAKCLFCPDNFEISESLRHLKEVHSFDLRVMISKLNMDYYNYIKMINYIRTSKRKASEIMCMPQNQWNDDKYLKPAMEDDALLMLDFDEIEDYFRAPPVCDQVMEVDNAEPNRALIKQVDDMRETIKILMEKLQERDTCLLRMSEDMQRMKEVAKKIIGVDDDFQQHTVQSISAATDDGYFQTYAHFDIHHQMLSDRVRTETYRDAILKNKVALQGKTVLDVGCGTGILSMFAASAGAASVIAIDQSEIIYNAMDIVRENHLEKSITLIKGRLEDTELPANKADIIISEWMGYFLLYEAMLDTVIYARDHHLSSGGLLLPNRCTVNLVGIEDIDRHKILIGFWEDVYGYQMTCMQSEVIHEPSVEIVPQDKIATKPCTLTEINVYTCSTSCINYDSEFSLEALRDCSITSFAGYFDVFFDLPESVQFSTGPHTKPTHWKQTVFLLRNPIPLKKGEKITGKLTCLRKDVRCLSVTISVLGQLHKFTLS